MALVLDHADSVGIGILLRRSEAAPESDELR